MNGWMTIRVELVSGGGMGFDPGPGCLLFSGARSHLRGLG